MKFGLVAVACPWAGEAWNLQEINLDEVAGTFQEVDTREHRLRPSDLKNDEAPQDLLQVGPDQMF